MKKSELTAIIKEVIQEDEKLSYSAGYPGSGRNRDPEIAATRDRIKKHISQFPEVSLSVGGRFTRKGNGIKGSFDELKSKIKSVSSKNLEYVSNLLGITWNEMIIYYVAKSGDWEARKRTAFAVKGTDAQGNEYLYDRFEGEGFANNSTFLRGKKGSVIIGDIIGIYGKEKLPKEQILSKLNEVITEAKKEEKINFDSIKDWRSKEWKIWKRQYRFPFDKPADKAEDMHHDGYNFKKTLSSVQKSFPGMTSSDIDTVKEIFN